MRTTAAALLALAGCAAAPPASTSRDVAVPLPELTLSRADGGTWTSASTHGAPLVVDVWASWCKPCSKGFPKLAALAARRPDIAVVAISIDEDAAAMRAFLAEHPAAVTVAQDADQSVTRAPLGVARLPTVLIVDADGTVRTRVEEPSERDYDQLETLVDRATARTSR